MLAELLFLVGCWQASINGGDTIIADRYVKGRSGGAPAIVGFSETLSRGRTIGYEQSEFLEGSEGVKLSLLLNEQDLSEFKLVHARDGKAMFENIRDDLPKKISYERDEKGRLVITSFGDTPSAVTRVEMLSVHCGHGLQVDR